MSNLPNIHRENVPPQRPEEGLITNELPLHLFENILSYLNVLDMQSASAVSKLWKAAAIDHAKHQEFSNIKNFIDFLCENLDTESHSDQIKNLREVIGEKKILQSVNLNQVKFSIFELREQVLNILKDLKDEDLASLEKISKSKQTPLFFEKAFDLARIYKRIAPANIIPEDWIREKELRDIANALVINGNNDKALKIINTLPEASQWMGLWTIAETLAESGKTDKALEVANTIKHNVSERGFALSIVSRALIKKGNIDKALDVAKSITNNKSAKDQALSDISKALLENNNIDKALEIANTITQSVDKGFALWTIATALAKSGNVDKALKVANTITDDLAKDQALKDIEKAKNL